MIDKSHLQQLHELNTDENPHSGGALLDHLRGTHDYLEAWGNDEAVCVGGLFHSIYGTQSYETESASLDDRQRIRTVIGERAERLAFLFSMTIRAGFFESLGEDSANLRDRATNEEIPITQVLGRPSGSRQHHEIRSAQPQLLGYRSVRPHLHPAHPGQFRGAPGHAWWRAGAELPGPASRSSWTAAMATQASDTFDSTG